MWRSSRLHEIELELAELLEAAGDLVAGLEPYPLLRRLALDHALGRAGEDDVARLERDVLRDVADHLLGVEDQVGGVRRLPGLAVDPALDLEVVGVDLIGGDQIWPDRAELIGRLADHPLAAGLELEVARAEVVAGRVAGDVAERVSLADVPGLPAHDDHQLDLMIELGRDVDRQLDLAVVRIER